jgi:glycosyltransferase involved in cell wall biosynthesis
MENSSKKILVCTGIYPPDIGGPAEYAKNLVEELKLAGHKVRVFSYDKEKNMPAGIRHIFFFFKILPDMTDADLIISLDTFSVGFPSVLAAKFMNRKIIVRVGGDFLWENYIESGGEMMTLKDFYNKKPKLSLKQKFIFNLSKYVFKNCSALVFSTDWQKKIISENYRFQGSKLFVVENFYGNKVNSFEPKEKNYIFAGRLIKLKNLERLKSAFSEAKKINSEIKLEILSKLPYEEIIKRLEACYAVILPSLSDVSPNFILDAVRANKPFIMTKETGFNEKLKGIGLFIDPFSQEEIREKILFLANDKNYQQYKDKVSNFKFVHSWKEITQEFMDIYKIIA